MPQLLWAANEDSWLIDMHGLGPSTAAAACIWWLERLRGLALKGQLPANVGIVTGWGKHRFELLRSNCFEEP